MKQNLFISVVMIGLMILFSSFTSEDLKVASPQVQNTTRGVSLVFMGGSGSEQDAKATLESNSIVVHIYGNYISRLRITWYRKTTTLSEVWYAGDQIPLYLSYGEYVEIGLESSVPYGGSRILRYKLVYEE